MNNYYVYMYRCQDDIPFYIGMGQNDRYLVSKHVNNHNHLLHNKINKIGRDNIKIHFFNKNLTHEEACNWERYWINYIGRRCTGEGTLCNFTEGGALNTKHSEETKGKISEALVGKILTNETRKRMSESRRGEKNPKAKLTKEDVLTLRQIPKSVTTSDVSRLYDASETHIGRIRRYERWTHI